MAGFQESLRFERRQGAAIGELFEPLAELRIAVFREFPYLYEGTTDYEKQYLQRYTRSEQAVVFAVFDGPLLVGATTALPLRDEMPELLAPFAAAGLDPDPVFYFGESLLLPAYRGRGLGHRFFDEREAHARQQGTYHTTCFCAVERAPDHPDRPDGYRSNEVFWQKRGYLKTPALQTTLDWPDRGQPESTPKTMTFWLRKL
jgi:GNAT superfamily N-acetyltransferase